MNYTVESIVAILKRKPVYQGHWLDFVGESVRWAPDQGLLLEFGVDTGTTIRRIAAEAGQRKVVGFDSFRGLPERWNDENLQGKFDRDGKPPDNLPANVELVVGMFDQTLPGFMASLKPQDRIAFVHVDCDLYSSTKTVLDAVAGRLAPEAVINFNEFWDYPGADQHEARAFVEFLNDYRLEAQCLGRSGTAYCQAAFRVYFTF